MAGGKVAFNAVVNFIFGFETGRTQPDPELDLWDVTWDYSWFGQDAEEASIVAALGGNCAVIATLLGVPRADVEQAVQVQRVWSVAANTQGSAAVQQFGQAGSAGLTVTEVMPYLVEAAGSDIAAAAEGAAAAPQ